MSEVKPLRPDEILSNLSKTTPTVIIAAVNNMLTKYFKGGSVTIKQKEIMAEILRLDSSLTSEIISENKWVDFEEVYRQFGWSVSYDGPAYCETYDATFKFIPKIPSVK